MNLDFNTNVYHHKTEFVMVVVMAHSSLQFAENYLSGKSLQFNWSPMELYMARKYLALYLWSAITTQEGNVDRGREKKITQTLRFSKTNSMSHLYEISKLCILNAKNFN
jgi:hypothetical protein